jgi:hypothetical protein
VVRLSDVIGSGGRAGRRGESHSIIAGAGRRRGSEADGCSGELGMSSHSARLAGSPCPLRRRLPFPAHSYEAWRALISSRGQLPPPYQRPASDWRLSSRYYRRTTPRLRRVSRPSRSRPMTGQRRLRSPRSLRPHAFLFPRASRGTLPIHGELWT